MTARELWREVLGVALLGLGAFALLAVASYSPGDDPTRVFPTSDVPANWGGRTGALLASFAVDWVGTLGAIAAGTSLLVLAVSLLGRPKKDEGDAAPERSAELWRRALGTLAVVLVLATIERVLARGPLAGHLAGRNPGGFWGTFIASELEARTEGPGAAVLLSAGALVGLVLATDRPLAEIFFTGARKAHEAAGATVAAAGSALDEAKAEAEQLARAAQAPSSRGQDVELPDLDPEIEEDELLAGFDEVVAANPAPVGSPAAGVGRVGPKTPPPAAAAPPAGSPVAGSPVVGGPGAGSPAASPAGAASPVAGSPAVSPSTNPVISPAPRGQVAATPSPVVSPAPTVIESEPGEKAAAPPPPPPPPPPPAVKAPAVRSEPDPERAKHELPPLTLLQASEAVVAADRTTLDERARRIEDVLLQFKLDAKVMHVERGPNVTLFALELGRGVKVQRVHALLDNLALALRVPGAGGIRVQAPVPGTSWVGLEVPNEDQDVVRLRELIENPLWAKKDPALPVFLGKDTAGRPLIADLAKMPHLLIAGATGSGKSVCLNTILLSILSTRTASEVKLILIDPKQVELQQFARVPHLLTPVVTEMKKAGAVLDWAVRKMEERYGWLAKAGVRHLREYNALGKEELAKRHKGTVAELEAKRIPWKLPYVVVVVDELNDLMMVAQKEVEASITRLAQKSRAVGIHVILATQRPSVDVITGVIKSNLPARIAFQVTSKVDSRTILDMSGAEKLLGMGDMLFLPPGRGTPIRAKGAFVSDEELDGVVGFLAQHAQPEFSEELAKVDEKAKNMRAAAKAAVEAVGSEDNAEDATRDSVYEDAVRCVLAGGKGSVSLIQRKLGVGYGRAARYVDMMAEDGILGPANGSKPRELRTTLEKYEAMLEARAARSGD